MRKLFTVAHKTRFSYKLYARDKPKIKSFRKVKNEKTGKGIRDKWK